MSVGGHRRARALWGRVFVAVVIGLLLPVFGRAQQPVAPDNLPIMPTSLFPELLPASVEVPSSPPPATVPIAPAPCATDVLTKPPDPMKHPLTLEMRNGVAYIVSEDKSFAAHVGAVVQYEGGWYSSQRQLEAVPGGPGEFQDAISPRRLRLRTEGNYTKNIEFFFEMEFFNGFNTVVTGPPTVQSTVFNPSPTDACLTLTEIPIVGNIRIGNQKEPFSLERLNSARFLEFMERSYLFDLNPVSSFNNNRSPGILFFRNLADGRIYTGVGLFKAVQNPFGYGIGDGDYAVTGRFTGLPIYEPDSEYYWHIGGAMSHRDPPNAQTRIRVRDLIRGAPGPFQNILAQTPLLGASSQDLFDIETAAVYGPVTFMSEYQINMIRGTRINGTGPVLGTTAFQGWYGEFLYFLTGESRKWRTGSANLDRVVPRRPFTWNEGRFTGYGAWEVGARYSYIDLNDGAIAGGRLNGVTLGLNWYWTGNSKLQFNYDYVYKSGAANPSDGGIVHSFGTRISYDF